MNITLIKTAAIAALAAVALCGCRTAPPALYQWGAYQPQVYQHFKGESPDQQIAVLERDLQVISSAGNKAPPGYHAQLGLLYSMTGKQNQVIAQFQEEKRLFPESETYMNLLIETMNKGGK